MFESKIVICVLCFVTQTFSGVKSTDIEVSDFKRYIHPEVIVTEHTPVTLECHSSSSPAVATWWYQRQLGDRERNISNAEGRIMRGYKHRFQLDKPWLGDYNLVINSTRSNDSGLYTCIEDGGFGDRHITKLTVREAVVVDKFDGESSALVGGKGTTDNVLPTVKYNNDLQDNESYWKQVAVLFIGATAFVILIALVVIAWIYVHFRKSASERSWTAVRDQGKSTMC